MKKLLCSTFLAISTLALADQNDSQKEMKKKRRELNQPLIEKVYEGEPSDRARITDEAYELGKSRMEFARAEEEQLKQLNAFINPSKKTVDGYYARLVKIEAKHKKLSLKEEELLRKKARLLAIQDRLNQMEENMKNSKIN